MICPSFRKAEVLSWQFLIPVIGLANQLIWILIMVNKKFVNYANDFNCPINWQEMLCVTWWMKEKIQFQRTWNPWGIVWMLYRAVQPNATGGPPLAKLNPREYAKSWMMSHRSSAYSHTRSAVPTCEKEGRYPLWSLFYRSCKNFELCCYQKLQCKSLICSANKSANINKR